MTERTFHRREACRSCPIDPNSGVCKEHRMVISSSRWVLGLMFALLFSLLGSIGYTYSMLSGELSEVKRASAVIGSRVERLEADVNEIRLDVKKHILNTQGGQKGGTP